MPVDSQAAIGQAAELAERGQVRKALELLNRLQGQAGLPREYFGLRGTLEARTARFRAAEEDLTAALAAGIKSPTVLYTLGLVRLQLNRPAEARDALLQRVQMLPPRPEAWLALGQAYAKLEDRRQAVASFDRALAIESNSAGVFFGAGVGYEGVGEFAKAAHALEQAAEIDPRYGMARAKCFRDLIRGELQNEASQLAQKWRDERKMTAAQSLEAGIVFAEARLFADAEAEFHEALQMDASINEAKYNLALAYLFEQKYDASAALAKELIEGNDAGQGHELFGLTKEEQGEPLAARAEFEMAVRANPRSADALFQLGRADLQLGKLEEAKREFSVSRMACAEACTAPLIGLATAYKLEGHFDQASRTMRDAINKNSSDAVNYLYLGDIEIRANQFQNAEKTLISAIRLDPQSGLARYMYAYALIKQVPGEPPQAAIDALESSIRLDPNSGLARLRLATILAKRGEYARAEVLLADAVRLEPGLKEAHLQYAAVLKKLGRTELATKELGQFQALANQRYDEDLRMMQELRHLPPITP